MYYRTEFTVKIFGFSANNGEKMNIQTDGKNLILKNPSCFNLGLCLDCGQAFRWEKQGDIWRGVARGKYLEIGEMGSDIVFYNTTEEDFNNIWQDYFDFGRDYEAILKGYTEENLSAACKEYYGIRILRQDSWEAICSFIISANNNIPRIKGIIARLCENFGEKTGEGYTFPSAQRLKDLTVEDLAPIRSGFRAKYILDAANKISSGEIDIEKIREMPFDDAKNELLKIKGVGEKVAQCALLYGFGRVEAFPVDVWVRRIVGELYPNGLPQCIEGTRGIAQQYLFHWRRNIDN